MVQRLVRKGDVEGVRGLIASALDPKALVNEVDERGFTPLYYALSVPRPTLEIVRLLLESGADPAFVKVQTFPSLSSDWLEELGEEHPEIAEAAAYLPSDGEPTEIREPLIKVALKGGSVEILKLLREYGADYGYHDENNYTAIIDAVYGGGDRLPVVRYLIGLGLDVQAVTSYGESAVAVAYHVGRFDVLAELLSAGADETPLQWAALHRAVSIGTLEDVRSELRRADDLGSFDCWGRTALHVALLKGSWEVIESLRQAGVDLGQMSKDGRASLSFAAEGNHPDLVRQILEVGCGAEDKDAALVVAVENGLHEVARVLLEAGADPNPTKDYGTLIEDAPDRDMILLLHQHGADLSDLDAAGRRRLLDLEESDEDALDGVSRDEYLAQRHAGEGTANPQDIGDPFRLAVVRAGWGAYGVRQHFEDPATFVCGFNGNRPPAVWCFDRFGQSTSILPDGRTLLIAGEHEDGYDPDFRIYNDVAVFDPDGKVTLLGYPFSVFPPTDFHTATFVGDWIYIIGSLGCVGSREGPIPVYRLSTEDFHIERVATTGDAPGRIFRHRATLLDELTIGIEGGTSITFDGPEENHTPNTGTYVLDLRTMVWSRI